MGGKSSQILGYRYFMGFHFALCHGPVDALNYIRAGDIEIWPNALPDSEPQVIAGSSTPGPIIGVTTSTLEPAQVQMFIDSPGAFGGIAKEGGIEGYLDVCWGCQTQHENAYLRSVLPGVVSNSGFIVVGYYGDIPPWTHDTDPGATNGYVAVVGPAPTGVWVGHANQYATWNSSIGTGTWEFTTPNIDDQVEVTEVNITYITWNGTAWTTIPNVGIPAFRGVFCLVANQIYMAAYNPYIKPWTVQVTRILGQFDGSAQWHPELAEVTTGVSNYRSGHSGDMNGAHIIRECLTNTQWGRGIPSTDIDDTSFLYAATFMFNEGLGLSMAWEQPGTVDDFMGTVLEHIDGVVFVDLTDGLWHLRLVRNDYTVSSLPVFDETSIISMEQVKMPTAGDLINQIQLTYHDRTMRKDSNVEVQNIASLQANGGKINQQTVNRTGISNATLAQRIALRELQSLSIPLLRATIHVNRTAIVLNLGDVFVLNFPEYGIESLVMRVAQINYGLLGSGAIVISCIQDVFSLPIDTYLTPLTTQWVPANNPPAAALYPYVAEATYYQIAQQLGETAVASDVGPTDGFLTATAGRPSQDATGMGVYYGTGSGTETLQGTANFCPVCRVPLGGVQEVSSTVVYDEPLDMDLVEAGTYAAWDNEIVAVESINTVTSTLTLWRGVLDTVPAVHAVNTRIQFIEGNLFNNTTQFVDGQTLYVKLAPRTSLGALALTSAPEYTYTFNDRQIRPYSPGNLTIGGTAYPATVSSANPVIAWSHRDRQLETGAFIEQNAGNIGPEANTTYVVTIQNSLGTTIETSGALTGTNYTPSTLTSGGEVTVYVQAIRTDSGTPYTSWQSVNATFDLVLPVLVAEAGAAVDTVTVTHAVVSSSISESGSGSDTVNTYVNYNASISESGSAADTVNWTVPASPYLSAVQADSPVSLYYLNDTTTTLTDHGSYGLSGTYSGPYTQGAQSLANEDTNASTNFNSGTAVVPGWAGGVGSNNFSLEVVFQSVSSSGNQSAVVLGGASGLELRINGSTNIQIIAAGTAVVGTVSGNFNDGAVHHIIVTVGGSNAVIAYVDGVSTSLGTYSSFNASPNEVTISGDPTSGGYNFPGALQYAAVYNTALSPTRVAAHFAALTNSNPYLVTTTYTQGSTSLTTPSRAQAGDLLIIALTFNGSTTKTLPSGFTSVYADASVAIGKRTMISGDVGASWALPASNNGAVMMAVRGGSGSVDQHSTTTSTGTATVSTPALTPSSAGQLALMVFSSANAQLGNSTPPQYLTTAPSINDGGSNDFGLWVSFKTLASTSSFAGDRVNMLNSSGSPGSATLLLLK